MVGCAPHLLGVFTVNSMYTSLIRPEHLAQEKGVCFRLLPFLK